MAFRDFCHVLPGWTGCAVQVLLFLITVGVLVAMKVREGTKRTWVDFTLDSSKQIIGAGWVHVMNLLCAVVLGRITSGDTCDECEWYWINIVLDTTVGVGVQYVLLRALTNLVLRCLQSSSSRALLPVGGVAEDFSTGDYRSRETGKVLPKRYLKQLALWLVVVSGMKLSIVLLMIVCSAPLQFLASIALKPFIQRPATKLIVVMVLTPMCMNAFQFWVTDNFLQKGIEGEGDAEVGGAVVLNHIGRVRMED